MSLERTQRKDNQETFLKVFAEQKVTDKNAIQQEKEADEQWHKEDQEMFMEFFQKQIQEYTNLS